MEEKGSTLYIYITLFVQHFYKSNNMLDLIIKTLFFQCSIFKIRLKTSI
jgi:hypothetical protein